MSTTEYNERAVMFGLFTLGLTVLVLILTGILLWGDPASPVPLKIFNMVAIFLDFVCFGIALWCWLQAESVRAQRFEREALKNKEYENYKRKINEAEDLWNSVRQQYRTPVENAEITVKQYQKKSGELLHELHKMIGTDR